MREEGEGQKGAESGKAEREKKRTERSKVDRRERRKGGLALSLLGDRRHCIHLCTGIGIKQQVMYNRKQKHTEDNTKHDTQR